MNTNEFLKVTKPEVKNHKGYTYQDVRPWMALADGTKMSVQASHYCYCDPREDGLDSYAMVEIGFPNRRIEALMEYAEDADEPTGTVYGFVPVAVIDQIIEDCGGVIGTVISCKGGDDTVTLFES